MRRVLRNVLPVSLHFMHPLDRATGRYAGLSFALPMNKGAAKLAALASAVSCRYCLLFHRFLKP
jgi:hypothetical protein